MDNFDELTPLNYLGQYYFSFRFTRQIAYNNNSFYKFHNDKKTILEYIAYQTIPKSHIKNEFKACLSLGIHKPFGTRPGGTTFADKVGQSVDPSLASSVTLQNQNPKFESLDLKSKSIQNVSLTWNPRRSVLKPSKAIIESEKLPKFILIGVMKCGTGAMSHFMNFHPSVSEPGFR